MEPINWQCARNFHFQNLQFQTFRKSIVWLHTHTQKKKWILKKKKKKKLYWPERGNVIETQLKWFSGTEILLRSDTCFKLRQVSLLKVLEKTVLCTLTDG